VLLPADQPGQRGAARRSMLHRIGQEIRVERFGGRMSATRQEGCCCTASRRRGGAIPSETAPRLAPGRSSPGLDVPAVGADCPSSAGPSDKSILRVRLSRKIINDVDRDGGTRGEAWWKDFADYQSATAKVANLSRL